jgi:arylsulfatase
MLTSGQGNAKREFFWEHEGNRAVRKGNWKLVALGGEKNWELYDVVADRLESKNLAETKPEIVKELAADYERWAGRCGVKDYSELQAQRKAQAK